MPLGLGPEDWIADSGCTNHMSPFRPIFFEYDDINPNIEVCLCDEPQTSLKIVSKGRIYTKQGYLKNVFYVPKLGQNLFSLTAAAENGIRLHSSREDINY